MVSSFRFALDQYTNHRVAARRCQPAAGELPLLFPGRHVKVPQASHAIGAGFHQCSLCLVFRRLLGNIHRKRDLFGTQSREDLV